MGLRAQGKVKRVKGKGRSTLSPFYFVLAAEPISVDICGTEDKETTE